MRHGPTCHRRGLEIYLQYRMPPHRIYIFNPTANLIWNELVDWFTENHLEVISEFNVITPQRYCISSFQQQQLLCCCCSKLVTVQSDCMHIGVSTMIIIALLMCVHCLAYLIVSNNNFKNYQCRQEGGTNQFVPL